MTSLYSASHTRAPAKPCSIQIFPVPQLHFQFRSQGTRLSHSSGDLKWLENWTVALRRQSARANQAGSPRDRTFKTLAGVQGYAVLCHSNYGSHLLEKTTCCQILFDSCTNTHTVHHNALQHFVLLQLKSPLILCFVSYTSKDCHTELLTSRKLLRWSLSTNYKRQIYCCITLLEVPKVSLCIW